MTARKACFAVCGNGIDEEGWNTPIVELPSVKTTGELGELVKLGMCDTENGILGVGNVVDGGAVV